MRRRVLVVALVVVLAAVAWVAGTWFGHRLPAPALPPTGLVVPIPAGAPERLVSVSPTSGTGENSGLGGMDTVLSRDGRTLADVDLNGSLATLDVASGQGRTYRIGTPLPNIVNALDYPQSRHGLALDVDARTAYVTDGWSRTLHVVDLASGAVRSSIPIPAIPTAVAVAGPAVVVGDATGAITVVDAASGRPAGFRDLAADAIAEVVATPDGRHLVVVAASTGGTGPSTVFAVDLANPVAPAVSYDWPVLHPRDLQGNATVVSPDGARAYVVSAPPPGARSFDGDTAGGVMALDLRTGQPLGTIPGPGAESVALSPDGRHVHIGRALETLHAGIVETASTIDTHDTGPGFPLIGSLTDVGSSPALSTLLAAPDGRRLYTMSGGSPTTVVLRGP